MELAESQSRFRRILGSAARLVSDAWEAARPPTHGIDWYSAAASGAHFLSQEPVWISRHVEQLVIETDRSAIRRLTIDIELPGPEAAFRREGAKATYCVPVTWMAKDPPTSRIDLKDESGDTLPLLTRVENGFISLVALLHALETATDADELSPDLEQAADLCVFDRGGRAFLGAGLVAVVPDREGLVWRDEEREHILRNVLRLSENSAVWLLLEGEPHERRVIKFQYAAPLGPPALLDRPLAVRSYTDIIDGQEVTLKELAPGSIRPLRSLRLLLQRMTASVGLGAIDLRIPVPGLTEPDSYHFQVQAPPGLEIGRLRVDGRLMDVDGREVIPQTQYQGRTGQLYFSGAVSGGREATATADEEPAPPYSIDVALRVARRGFLNLSVVSSALIAGALWGYVASVTEATDGENEQVAAAVLLIAPALLVVFAVRPEEHAWSARLLAGIRAVMLGSGLLAASGAAALVGVSPWGDQPSEALLWYAAAATVAASMLASAWLTTWEPRRWWLRRRPSVRQFTAGAFLGLLAAAATGQLVARGVLRSDADTLSAAQLLPPFVFLAAWAVLGLGHRPTIAVSFAQRASVLAGAAAAAAMTVVTLGSSEPEPTLTVLCGLALIAAGATAIFGRRARVTRDTERDLVPAGEGSPDDPPHSAGEPTTLEAHG